MCGHCCDAASFTADGGWDAAEVRMIFLPAPVNPSLKTYTLVGMSFTGLQAYCAKTPSGKLAA